MIDMRCDTPNLMTNIRGLAYQGTEALTERLIEKPPEVLHSRFDVNHGMLVSVLQREKEQHHPGAGFAQQVDRAPESGLHACFEALSTQLANHADREPGYSIVESDTEIRHIAPIGGGVEGIVSSHHLQKPRRIFHRARHRAGAIQR